jgi:hypothetical protein
MVRAVMQPVSGTFELRWRWHRGDARPPGRDPEREARRAEPREPALAGPRPRLDEVPPRP